jgi:hypothetical protein
MEGHEDDTSSFSILRQISIVGCCGRLSGFRRYVYEESGLELLLEVSEVYRRMNLHVRDVLQDGVQSSFLKETW